MLLHYDCMTSPGTDLSTITGRLRGPSVVSTDGGGGFYVAVAHAGQAVGFHLVRTHPRQAWDLVEMTVQRRRGAELTSQAVRALPIGKLMAAARRLASEASGGPVGKSPTSVTASLLQPFYAEGRGKARRVDADYAVLALVYANLIQSGDRSPSVTLAELGKRQAGERGGTVGTWTNRVKEARRRGLLTGTTQGEAGGRLTAKAERILGLDRDAETDKWIHAQG